MLFGEDLLQHVLPLSFHLMWLNTTPNKFGPRTPPTTRTMLARLSRCATRTPTAALAPRCTALARGLVCAPPPSPPLPDIKCATIESIHGHKIVSYIGLVEGSTVRTKNVAHDLFASIRQVMGGELTSYTDLLREARAEATERMNTQAAERGANAIVGVRMTSSSVAAGASEILAYGTAVVVEKL